jgi:hypothetical protein
MADLTKEIDMATPSVSASLDKIAYAVGELMTLTVTYSDPDTDQVQVTITVTDQSGNQSAPTTVTAVIDPLTVGVTDPDRTWTKVSDNGSVAVFTATA